MIGTDKFNQEHEVKIRCMSPSDRWPFECSSIPGGGEGENKMKEISTFGKEGES